MLCTNLHALLQTEHPDLGLELRGAFIESLLAQTIAYRLSIPAEPVESVALFYSNNHSAEARRLVSAFNEGFALQVQSVLDLAFLIWKARYYMVYEPGLLLAPLLHSLIPSIPLIATAIPPRYQPAIPLTTTPAMLAAVRQCLSEGD